MNFEKEYIKIYIILRTFQKKSRVEGLLALEGMLEELQEYSILKEGLRLVVDGTDAIFIEEYYNNIIKVNYERSTKSRLLIELMKTGTLHIQNGSNEKMLNLLARSLCPLSYKKVHETIKTLD